MKIVHVIKSRRGGAGIAAARLNDALLSVGVVSNLLVIDELKKGACVDKSISYLDKLKKILNKKLSYAKLRECDAYTTCFSEFKVVRNPMIMQADIVHFHWLGGSLDLKHFLSSYRHHKFVWTMHDMNCFTGGCHYSGGCFKYKSLCFNCWQINSYYLKYVALVTQYIKKQLYAKYRIHFISPSKWLFNESKESSLFKKSNVYCIHNCIEQSGITNCIDASSRDGVNDKFLIMFCADLLNNKRKGLSSLVNALSSTDDLRDKVKLRIVGNNLGAIGLEEYEIELIDNVDDQAAMAELYKTSDLFVLPSQEDNLPNTMLEAMLNETPVLAFDIGGVSTFIDNNIDGFLVDPKKPNALVGAIRSLLNNPQKLTDVAKRAKRKILEKNNYNLIASEHIKLYKRIL